MDERLTKQRQYYPESGLPVLPNGYFWRVENRWTTGSPYLHLRQEIDLYFFKFSVSLDMDFIGYSVTREGAVRSGNKLMNRFEGTLPTSPYYGDIGRKK
jgi:hypothetical protein